MTIFPPCEQSLSLGEQLGSSPGFGGDDRSVVLAVESEVLGGEGGSSLGSGFVEGEVDAEWTLSGG